MIMEYLKKMSNNIEDHSSKVARKSSLEDEEDDMKGTSKTISSIL